MPTTTSNFTNSPTQPKKNVSKVPKSKKVLTKTTRAELDRLLAEKASSEKVLAEVEVIKKALAVEKKEVIAEMARLEKQIREQKEKDDRQDAYAQAWRAEQEEAENMIRAADRAERREREAWEMKMAKEDAVREAKYKIAEDARLAVVAQGKKNVGALILSSSIVSRSSTTRKNVKGQRKRLVRMATNKEKEAVRIIEKAVRSYTNRRDGYDSDESDDWDPFESGPEGEANRRGWAEMYNR